MPAVTANGHPANGCPPPVQRTRMMIAGTNTSALKTRVFIYGEFSLIQSHSLSPHAQVAEAARLRRSGGHRVLTHHPAGRAGAHLYTRVYRPSHVPLSYAHTSTTRL